MKRRYFIFFALIAFSAQVMAQTQKKTTTQAKPTPAAEVEPGGNLISDASFEVSEVKLLKGYNQLTTFLKSWSSPNATSADLYNNMVKSTKVSVPKNDYGTEEPIDGSSYAGFRAFTKDPKKTRTYVQTKLTKKMSKDKLYCVRFNVSLADLSKWGVNNIGVFVSDRKIQNTTDNALTFIPHITEKSNKSIITMEGWETICGTYLATGKEEYIVIGCFGTEDNLRLEKVKKPASQEGVVMADAYYYLDNVEIVEIEAQSQCFCGKTEDRDPDLIYSRSTAKGIDMKPEQIVTATAVWFSFLSAEIPNMFEPELQEIITIMKNDPDMKIELVGHSELDEINEAKINRYYLGIAQTRAESVKKYLVDNGIDAASITITSKDNTVPASVKTTPLGKAQNRRVEFIVK
jgi:outer membrane protein OmpA-like peptidoglycan-associated protein